MYYQLRREDGSADQWSRGSFVAADGTAHRIGRDDIEVDVLATWRSPRGGTYPVHWRLRVPRLDLALEVAPVFDDQEHDTYVRYWEGAVDVHGERAGTPVLGRGYVELTGYADPPR
jgi:predicted secreted hydrolase